MQVFTEINTCELLLVCKFTGKGSKADNPLNWSNGGISFTGPTILHRMDSSAETCLNVFYELVVSDWSSCPRVMPDSLKQSFVFRIGKP